MKNSPCQRCTRVRDPEACENKNCQAWQQWFIARWNRMRQMPRQLRQQSQPEPVGVSLGGRHYAAPHQVSHYLHTDPCHSCLCPSDLCVDPCRVRLAWEKAVREVGQ